MDTMKVVVTDYIEPNLDWEMDQFGQMGVDFACYQMKHACAAELVQAAADADVLIVNMAKMTQEVMEGLTRTKLIIRHGVGYDNIDVAAATRMGIVVSYMPDYCMHEVAEQAVMLILACQRKLLVQSHLAAESSRQGKWVFDPVYPVHSLKGKTLGIIGCGRIGSIVHTMVQGFHLNRILVCDPYLSDKRRQALPDDPIPLDTLLAESDIVTIHTPLGPETYHLLDQPQFARMKPTAILVNTSRGGVVNLEALDRALREGQLMGAGIDVYEEEPPNAAMPLLHNPKAICTPHLGWLSEESSWNIREKIVEDVRRFLQNEGPRYPINKEIQIQFGRA